MMDYRDRDETLRLLGFPDYPSYLRSRLWRLIRRRAFAINGRSCRGCGGEAVQIHHASYLRDVLTGEDVRPLTPVCRGCHKLASLGGDGRVRAVAETNRVICGIAAKRATRKRQRARLSKRRARWLLQRKRRRQRRAAGLFAYLGWGA